MSSTLVQLTADIVSSHASSTSMSSEDLVQEIQKVFSTLQQLETGNVADEVASAPAMTMKKAFQKDQVACMICGKTGFKTLTRHLKQAHDLKPGQYRRQFNISSSQSLTAKSYSEARRQAANENNLAANLEKARAVRAAKKAPVVKEMPVVAAEKPAAENPAKAVKAVKKPAKARVAKA